MSSLRDRILENLQNFVSEDDIAKSLARVIKGERTVETFTVLPDGERVLKEVQVTISPADATRGLMVWDGMHGGKLGIAPTIRVIKKAEERTYGAFAPARDDRIVARKVLDVPVPAEEAVPVEAESDNTGELF